MRAGTSDKIYTVEEYIQHELSSQVRSEFVNGQLFEMSGEKGINNRIALSLVFLFMQVLNKKGFEVYAHDMKVKIHWESKYFYPDVFITKEIETEDNVYFKNEPVLIVEVVSPTSQVNDYVDKFINYTKIPSLQYYLIVEPENTLINCYTRGENNGWETTKYTKSEDVVSLPDLDVSFSLQEVYT